MNVNYDTWLKMKEFCMKSDDPNDRYSKQWTRLSKFTYDMGEIPKNYYLARHDRNRMYSRSNCYWSKKVNRHDEIAICNSAIEHFGMDKQVKKSVEELTELSLELIRELSGNGNRKNIIDEMVDVEIMLSQLKIMYLPSQTDFEEFNERRNFKLTRLKNNIESERNAIDNDCPQSE